MKPAKRARRDSEDQDALPPLGLLAIEGPQEEKRPNKEDCSTQTPPLG